MFPGIGVPTNNGVHGWGGGGGRRKDEMKLNGPSPPPFYKAARQPKSRWADFAIIAKFCQKLDLPAK